MEKLTTIADENELDEAMVTHVELFVLTSNLVRLHYRRVLYDCATLTARRKTRSVARAREALDATYDAVSLKERLSDEYKILQDKIDKIGSFRFTIKGWSVTAVIAASAAASTTGRLTTALTVSVGLVLMLAFFFWLKFQQVRLSWLFGDRAARVEDAFRQIDRGKGMEVHVLFRVPYTAHESALAGYRRKSQPERYRGQNPAESTQRSRWAERWHISRKADILFYLMFAMLAFVPLVPHYREIVRHGCEMRNKIVLLHFQTKPVVSPSSSSPNTERK